MSYCPAESLGLDHTLLSPFALACFTGAVDNVKEDVSDGTAPDLTGTETPFKCGYATFVVLGAQRVQVRPGSKLDHLATLRYLLRCGAPPDIPNIIGMSALQHACTAPFTKPVLARALLQAGANVNHQNRYGDTPIFSSFMGKDVAMIELLMEYGASLDICEGNGVSPRKAFVSFGPQVTAAVQRWERRRNGEEALLDDKKCGNCGKKGDKQCSRCQTVRYCSSRCQTSHWPVHKPRCRSFSKSATISVKPGYDELGVVTSRSDLVRQHFDIPTVRSNRESNATPKNPTLGSMVIKIQVPVTVGGIPARNTGQSLLVYNRKRDFTCSISKAENPVHYDEIVNTVLSKGVNGVKAYFVAELKSRDELVVKISEVLAEQSF
ncbi:ankyrin [Leucogyrophana mollusca]|uniref:Ankyrin n=1 Tax=Leucogyrophana mollusca TaxID=85980 RepID=A0ACB8B420_9AGAM|nr:ankyrin [Leucogyrophana mollusca]